jgi:hypothetical protein
MIDFPANPTTGQSFTAAGVTWVWDGQKWNVNSVAAGQYIIISATPPTNPIIGSLWWDSTGGQLYIYYNDGNSAQWVTAINQGFGGLYLPLAGGTLSGPLLLAADPTVPLGAATKEYVDADMAAVPANYPLNSNRIINGDMRIDQRNNGASGTAIAYTVDRWQFASSLATKGTWQRNGGGSGVSGPATFPYCLGFASNSAYTVLAGDYFRFVQYIEADAISDLVWGTANAKPVTLSFWVYSSLTGTFGASLANYASTRTYPFTYSIPTANTWTKITITIPGDTAGTWVMSGNAGSLGVHFALGVGATYSGPANAWTSTNYVSVTGAVSVVGTNGATFYITGVKLEIGSVATPFNYDSLAKRLVDCQRYYQVLNSMLYGSWQAASTAFYGGYTYNTVMRAAPTGVFSGQSYSNASALGANAASLNVVQLTAVATAAGYAWAGGTIALNAEL